MIKTNKPLTKREKDSQQKKEKIFNVSMKLFKEYGYHNVTMKQISKESGISEGSIYNFFGDKAGILSLIAEEIQKEKYILIEPTNEHLNTPYLTIYNYLMAQINAYESLDTELTSIYFLNSNRHYQTMIKQRDNFMNYILSSEPDLMVFIQKAIETNKMNIEIPIEDFAFILINTITGLISSWMVHGNGYSLQSAAEKILPTIIKSLMK